MNNIREPNFSRGREFAVNNSNHSLLRFYVPDKVGGLLRGARGATVNRTMDTTVTDIKFQRGKDGETETMVEVRGPRENVVAARNVMMQQLVTAPDMITLARVRNLNPTVAAMEQLTKIEWPNEQSAMTADMNYPSELRRNPESSPTLGHFQPAAERKVYRNDFMVKIGQLLQNGGVEVSTENGLSVTIEGHITYDKVDEKLQRMSNLPLVYTIHLHTPTGWRKMTSLDRDNIIWKTCLIDPPVCDRILYVAGPTEKTIEGRPNEQGSVTADISSRSELRRNPESSPTLGHFQPAAERKVYRNDFMVKIGQLLPNGGVEVSTENGLSVTIEGHIRYDKVVEKLDSMSSVPLGYTLHLDTPTGWRRMTSQDRDHIIWKTCLIDPPVCDRILYVAKPAAKTVEGSAENSSSSSSQHVESSQRRQQNTEQVEMLEQKLQRLTMKYEVLEASEKEAQKECNRYMTLHYDKKEEFEQLQKDMYDAKAKLGESHEARALCTKLFSEFGCQICFELASEMIFCTHCQRIPMCVACFVKLGKTKKCITCQKEWPQSQTGTGIYVTKIWNDFLALNNFGNQH